MSITVSETIKQLEHEWNAGFLWKLRHGELDRPALTAMIDTLARTDIGSEGTINKRLVTLLWYMPIIMRNQRTVILRSGVTAKEYDETEEELLSGFEMILNVP